MWDFGTTIKISYMECNKFAVTFGNVRDKIRVNELSPWAIKGNIIILKQRQPNLALEELSFQLSPFWIEIHNIPLNRMHRENAVRFGNFIGKFLKTNRALEEDRPHRYLQVQVEVDTCKALKIGVYIKNDDGFVQWLAFKYERLSDCCFSCGRLGHVITSCSATITHVFGPLDPQTAFGPWLRTSRFGIEGRGFDPSSPVETEWPDGDAEGER